MTKECFKAARAFLYKFGYYVEVPGEVILETDETACKEFCEVLQRSIDTGVDETIEKYGTDPTYGTMPDDGIYID